MVRKTALKTGLIENRYRVLSVVSLDRMGALYRVSDEARERKIVALKIVILDVPAGEKPGHVEQFQREFEILTQLHHPNLVDVYDYGITAEDELYFTMEWVEGRDLDALKCKLEPAAVTSAMVQVCRALAYLHARGVIHGDLKPSNVLIVGDADAVGRQVKLVDFGVALETRTRRVQARYYTPGYTAPEIKESRPADRRADLYGLGATWYAALVGEAPVFMSGPDKEPLIQLTLEQALGPQSRVPAEIGAVIVRLMAMSPADRYGSANEVIEAVNEITGSAYQLETPETASSYALRARFVGRGAEMGMLQTLWEQAQAGEGKLALVSGEAGVGKTRLVEEFVVQAELEGARVAWGQCVEGAAAYRPWREVLWVLLRYVEGANEAELEMERVGPVLGVLLPVLWKRAYMRGLVLPADLEPQAARLRLNDAIVQVLRAAAELRPTVVVIDDAQWADEATLELLRFLARSCGRAAGLQICITYRDDEGGAAQSLVELANGQVEHIPLRRLPPESTTDLVRSMLGLEQLPTLLMEQVQRTTKGNAFFVQELIRSLAEDGIVLQRTVEGWQVDRAVLRDARLPESIRQVAWRRLAHLSAETREVLCWASVVGPMFWDGVLEKIGQVSRERVQTALGEGLERELIFERDTSAFAGEREFLFAKPAVQEVGCESISQEERREAHRRAAAWLMARRDGEVSEHLGLIADHLGGAGQMEQAIIYLRRAGEQAAAQFANVEAAAYFSRALDLTPAEELDRRYDLLLEREKVYGLQGAREAQREDLAALEKLARVLDDDWRRAEVALRQADYAEATANYPAAIAAARAAIHLGQTTQDASTEAAGYLRWGWAFWRQGKYKAAQSKLERALALAQAAVARKAAAYSLLNLGVIFIDQDNFARAAACYEQALHICREIGDRQGESWAFNDLGIISLYQGDYDEARAYWEQALRIAREIGDRRNEAIKLCNLGKLFADQGDYARARVCYEQSLRLKREVGDRDGVSLTLTNLGLLFHHLGDNEAAREYSQRALLIAQEIGDRRIEGAAWMNLGHALVDLGCSVEATDAYQKALALWRELGQSHMATEPLAGLARVSLIQGDLAQAQAYVEEILRYLDQGKSLGGVEEPLRVHLTCCRVLRANRDPRAETILNTAYRLLQERAAKIEDEKLRRSFLEDVSAHREIAREAASLYRIFSITGG